MSERAEQAIDPEALAERLRPDADRVEKVANIAEPETPGLQEPETPGLQEPEVKGIHEPETPGLQEPEAGEVCD